MEQWEMKAPCNFPGQLLRFTFVLSRKNIIYTKTRVILI
jgi:hypothetical protein